MTTPENVTIRSVQRSVGGQGFRRPASETTRYVSIDRRREEHVGWWGYRSPVTGRDHYRRAPRTAMITRYDARQQFHINFDDRQYANWPLPTLPLDRGAIVASGIPIATPQHGAPTLLVETETVDTGERRSMFGWTARHVVITQRINPLERARHGPRTTVTDGWYIDLELPNPEGHRRPRHAFATIHKQGEPPDWPSFKDIGEPERGFAVYTKHSSSDRTIDEMEVIELVTLPIDPAVFEVPPGFSQVEQIRQEPVPPLVIRLDRWYRALRPKVRRS